MDKEKKQKELEAKYSEHQIIEQSLTQFQKQAEALDMQMIEVNNIIQGVDDIKNTEKGKDILVPLANGIFVKGKLEENKKLLVNVGAGIVVENTIEETKKMMQKQLTNVEKMKENLLSKMQKLILDLSNLESDMQKLMSE